MRLLRRLSLRRLLAVAWCVCVAPFAPAVLAADAASPACPAVAQPMDAAELQAGLRDAQDRGLLWRVEKSGHVSWLYGTIHVAERGWVFPGPVLQRTLTSADRIALELNMLDPDIVAQLGAAIKAVPGAPPLPAPLAQRLQAQAGAACMGDALSTLRPDMQATTLVMLAARADGLDPAYGIDTVLAGFGAAQHKPVLSLETPAEQMALLLSDDPAEVAKAVDEALQSLEKKNARPVMRRLANAWAGGRIDELEHYADWCECADTPEERQAYDRLVVSRNPVIVRRMVELHEAGHSVFAAVGALHMVGAQGLPALLTAEGFSVTRVPFQPLRAEPP